VPAHVVRAKARLGGVLVDELMTVVRAVAEYRKAVDDFFVVHAAARRIKPIR